MRRKATIEELVRLYFEEGKSLRDVGRIVHLTKSNIRNRLVAAGRTTRSPMYVGWVNPHQAPSEHPTILDVAWAAGVYEGEGSVVTPKGWKKIPGSRFPSGRRPIISVVQKEGWLCHRLQALFGGSVRQYRNLSGRSYYYWRLSGVRGMGFLMTIYILLSPRRREQVRVALNKTGLDAPGSQEAMAQ